MAADSLWSAAVMQSREAEKSMDPNKMSCGICFFETEPKIIQDCSEGIKAESEKEREREVKRTSVFSQERDFKVLETS